MEGEIWRLSIDISFKDICCQGKEEMDAYEEANGVKKI